ncbi:hypothetical protein [Loktanella sp. 3ANDIMAR09]|uniref:hypothetical protein n=1 Tax=Loktanella sp. 3ANDIMAR09 TaxID=1225657 RepID=UPI001C101CA5|nr:hypothetical protein [Loktanella sp. 3ANDIMAR09]
MKILRWIKSDVEEEIEKVTRSPFKFFWGFEAHRMKLEALKCKRQAIMELIAECEQ